MLHGREEPEVPEHLHEVVEADELPTLGEGEVQGIDHGQKPEGQKQYHVATGEHVAGERLRAGSAWRLPSGDPPPPPCEGRRWALWRRCQRWCFPLLLVTTVKPLTWASSSYRCCHCLDLTEAMVLPAARAGATISAHGRLGAEGQRGTPAVPDVVGCLSDDVLERVRVGPVSARGLRVQPLRSRSRRRPGGR